MNSRHNISLATSFSVSSNMKENVARFARTYFALLQSHFLILVFLSMWFIVVAAPVHTSYAQGSSGIKSAPLESGDEAPSISLSDFNGNRFVLSDVVRDKTVLLWFTNLCSGCRSRIPDLQKLHEMFEKDDVEIVAVSELGKDRKTVEHVIKSMNITFRFLYDPDGKATKRFSGKYIEGTCPLKNLYVIERGGKITLASHLARLEIEELIEVLDTSKVGKHE